MNLDPQSPVPGIGGRPWIPRGQLGLTSARGTGPGGHPPSPGAAASPCFRGRAGTWTTTCATAGEGILYAVTLGPEADRLLRRWSAQSMAKAAVGQAVCAAWLDDLCAAYCATLEQDLAPGSTSRPPTALAMGTGTWGPAVGPGPPPGPQAPGAHPHRRGDAGAREVGDRPGGHQRPERGGLQAKNACQLHQNRLPLPGRASGGSPRTPNVSVPTRERALSGPAPLLYLTRKGRLSQ